MDELLKELKEIEAVIKEKELVAKAIRETIRQHVEVNGELKTDIAVANLTAASVTISYDRQTCDEVLATLQALAETNRAVAVVHARLLAARKESFRDGSLRIKFK